MSTRGTDGQGGVQAPCHMGHLSYMYAGGRPRGALARVRYAAA
jgi:hypothetical protein